MIYTELLKNMWNDLYNPKIEVIKTIDKYFHHDYEQCINGISMKRNEYVQHVLEQRKNLTINIIDYKQILEKENEVFAIYYPKGKNVNHLPIEAEVISYFCFENKKIIKIHGLVRLIKGNLEDVDMLNTD